MTRRQLTDPFGSDDEEENIQVVEDKLSRSISITKVQTPVRDVSIHVKVQTCMICSLQDFYSYLHCSPFYLF
jgi:hypothetical protein